MSTASHAIAQESKVRTVFRVVSGNFLEMYDFMVYGYYASAIAKTYFPSGNAFASLMLSLSVFGAGFLMRPVGAIVLGAYIDHHGRRKGLILTLGLMAIGTLAVAAIPGYATIGVLAPILVLLGRLLQGFSAGVELGGVSVYLSEIATKGHKGFYTSWQSGSQQVAVVFAALVGVLLNRALPAEEMTAWGWRIPFLIGCLIVPFLFLIRRSLKETDEFLAKRHRPTMGEIMRSMLDNWGIVVAGMGMVIMTTVSFYMITAYTPTFGKEVLHLSSLDALVVTVCVGISNLVWLPLSGALSDRIGRRNSMLLFGALSVLGTVPLMKALATVTTPLAAFGLITVALAIVSFYTSISGLIKAEMFPPEVRAMGVGLSYAIANAVFGGSAEYVALWFKQAGSESTFYWYVTALCAVSFVVTYFMPDPSKEGYLRHTP